jgi:dihydrolipoamide dehydrogenase
MSAFDLVVIGSGPGGYVAAIRAAQLGLKTAVVEREHLGGVCLNWGCIPSKALLRSAEIVRLARHGEGFGLEFGAPPALSVSKAVSRSRAVSRQLNAGVAHLLQKNGVSVLWGEARVSRASPEGRLKVTVSDYKSPLTLPQHPPPSSRLGPGQYDARHVIVATGARPRVLPELPVDEEYVWSYYAALMPECLPTSLIIVGAGAIGVEFACFYRSLGIDVLLIEAASTILPAEDAEIVQIARRQLQKQGIRILTGVTVEASTRTNDGVSITVKNADGQSETHSADRVISAVGVVANTAGLGLEDCGVELERGWIKTRGAGRTNVDGLYAIGDVAGPPMLAHKAEHEGIACVEAIAGQSHHEQVDEPAIPACIFSNPNIASIGMTEAGARAAGLAVRVGKFPLRANGKALAYGETDGLVKVLFDAGSDRVLGAQMIGSEVPELIGTIATAIAAKMTYAQFRRIVFPHPTIAEAIFESALAAHESAIHV